MKTKNLVSYWLFFWVMISGFILITLNACGGLNGKSELAINQGRQSPVTHGKWTRVSGDSMLNQSANFGTRGVAAGTNTPGARYGSISWADSEGNLWLFGGDSGRNFQTLRNDLWKFGRVNWTWVSGDSKANQRGVYGTKGVAADSNNPGARCGSISWTDSKDNLWLFGGAGYAGTGFLGYLNDLWKFDGTNWIWISGDNPIDELNVEDPDDMSHPFARYDSVSWVDNKGNLWLFGGRRLRNDLFNDLWKFEPES